MADKEAILKALQELDVLDDDNWTTDGAPLVDVVSKIVGEAVTRRDIVEASPAFSRSNPSGEVIESEEETTDPEEASTDKNQDVSVALNKMSFEELQDVYDNLAEQRLKNEKAVEALKEEGAKLKLQQGEVKVWLHSFKENSSDTSAIQDYIKSQTAARADRAARRNKVLQHISPKDMDPRAPIDAAMSRKTNRGTARPTDRDWETV